MKIIAEIHESEIKGLDGTHIIIEIFDPAMHLSTSEIVPTDIFKSNFDTVWEAIGKKFKQKVLDPNAS